MMRIRDYSKKIAFVLLFVFAFNTTVVACGPTFTIGDLPRILKDYIADTIVNGLVNAAVAGFAKSITKWAADGFDGKPAFSQNLTREFKKLEGDALEEGLNQIKVNNVKLGAFLCGPFSQEINDAFRVNLATKRADDTSKHSQCSVDKILKEAGYTLKDFEDDFDTGGWPAWVELTNNPANDRFSLYLTIQEDLWSKQSEESEKKAKELSFGSGFLSKKTKGECPMPIAEYEAAANENLNATDDPDERASIIEDIQQVQDYAATNDGCAVPIPVTIDTPGQTIQNSLAKGLGLPADRLAVADELDEMIGAVAQGFILKMFQSTGIAGSNKAKPGEKSLVDQVGEEGDKNAQDNKNKATSRADGAVDNAKKIADLTDKIDSLQGKIDRCLAINSANMNDFEVTTTTDPATGKTTTTITPKQGSTDPALIMCPGYPPTPLASLINQLEEAKAEFRRIIDEEASTAVAEATEIAGTDEFSCRYLFDSKPAASPVNWSSAGPVSGDTSGKQKGTKLTVPGGGTGFYKSYEVNFDMYASTISVQAGSVKIVNFTPGDAKNFYNGAELGITDAGHGGLNKSRYDNNSYAGGPKYFGNNPTHWTENTNYHITIKYDAQAYSLYTKIVNKDTNQVVGEFSIARPLAAQDIACTVEQCHLTLVGEPGWRFTNMSVNMTPGGPYADGMAGRCGLTQ